MKDIIINLSQRGGSHLRPLMAVLNREFPQGDFKAKSGNICLKLTSILTWLNKEVTTKNDVYKYWHGTNRHNQIQLIDLLPIGFKKVVGGWELIKTDKPRLLCGLVWESDKAAVQAAMDAMADFLIKKVA